MRALALSLLKPAPGHQHSDSSDKDEVTARRQGGRQPEQWGMVRTGKEVFEGYQRDSRGGMRT